MQKPKYDPVRPPAPTARLVDDAILEARRHQRRMVASRQGYKSTKTSGPLGVTGSTTLSSPAMTGS